MFTGTHSFKDEIPFWGVLALFLVVQGLFLKTWIVKDQQPAMWDESIHARVALEYTDRYAKTGLSEILEPAYFNYPPLYHYTLAPVLSILTDPADAGPALNFIYFSLLLVVVFLLGTELAGPWSGLTAALMTGALPIIQQLLRLTLIDLSLTFWVTAAFYALFKSEEFNDFRWSVLFGMLLGLGMLAKWTALAYLIGPLVYVGYAGHKAGHGKTILISAGVFLLFTLPWYIANFFPMMARVFHVSSLVPATGEVSGVFARLFWYLFAFVEQMNPIFFLFLIPGLAVGIWRPRYWPLILWLLVPVVLFTLIHNRNIRYTAPVLPAAALLAVGWLPDFRRRVFVGVQILIVAFFLIFQTQGRSWGDLGWTSIPSVLFRAAPPAEVNWRHEEIIKAVLQLGGTDRPFIRVVTVSNSPWLHSTTLNVSLHQKKRDNVSFRGPSRQRWFEFSEFILYKTGEFGKVHSSGSVEKIGRFLENPSPWFYKVFYEVGRWDLPDGTEAILWQQIPRPDSSFKPELLNIELDEMEAGRIKAKGVKFNFTPSTREDMSLGKGQRLEVSAEELNYKNLRFENVGMTLIEPQINLPLFLETQELRFLSLKELRPSGAVRKEELLQYASRKLDWLKEPDILLEGSDLQVSGKAFGIPLLVRAEVLVRHDAIETHLQKLKIAGIPFPLILIRSVTDRVIPLRANRETPFRLGIRDVRFEDGKLAIYPEEDNPS